MSKEIPIENFLRMIPQVPEYSSRNPNYLISGVNPLSYLDDGSQEEQIAPLSASIDWTFPPGVISSGENVVDMIPSTEGTYSVYFITDSTQVYGLSSTGFTSLGFPSGSSVSNAGGRLAIAAGYIFAIWQATVYRMELPSGSWTAISGTTISYPGGVHFMEPFLDFIALADSASGDTPYSYIDKLDPSAFTVTNPPAAGIDLGTGIGIIGLKNYNDKYLAIAAGKTSYGGGVFGFAQNYIFLWDGISNTYNYSVRIPGKYVDMKVVDSVLYVAVESASSKSTVYYLDNTALKKSFNVQYSNFTFSKGSPVPCALFDFKNYLGINLNSPTNNEITFPLMVQGQDEMGAIEFIHSSGRSFDQICTGFDGNIYANVYFPSGTSEIVYLPTVLPFSGIYQSILYKSQWIPVANLQSIDIYYDTPPQSGTDAINVTIFGRGEDILSGSSTTVLQSINPANFLTQKRTRLDVLGFTGDKVKIQLSTVNSAWQPKIRGIILITK